MSEIVKSAAEMMELLPDEDKTFAYEFIKKLVLAWDPDFTKLTAEERSKLEKAEKDEFVNSSDIDWDNLEKYAD